MNKHSFIISSGKYDGNAYDVYCSKCGDKYFSMNIKSMVLNNIESHGPAIDNDMGFFYISNDLSSVRIINKNSKDEPMESSFPCKYSYDDIITKSIIE